MSALNEALKGRVNRASGANREQGALLDELREVNMTGSLRLLRSALPYQ